MVRSVDRSLRHIAPPLAGLIVLVIVRTTLMGHPIADSGIVAVTVVDRRFMFVHTQGFEPATDDGMIGIGFRRYDHFCEPLAGLIVWHRSHVQRMP